MRFSHTYIVHLNHAVRKANAPEMLSDGEYISDVEEGICTFLLWWNLTTIFISHFFEI